MKVLFVGLGGIGQRHLRNLVNILGENVEVYAFRVRRSGFVLNDKLQILDKESLEEKYNIHVLENIDEAWEIGVDCVFVCNPSSLHMEILLKAARNNCHIFVENHCHTTMKN